MFKVPRKISDIFAPSEWLVVYQGSCLELLKTIPAESIQLIVTSPPYNIGKEYERISTSTITSSNRGESLKSACVSCLHMGAFAGRSAIT